MPARRQALQRTEAGEPPVSFLKVDLRGRGLSGAAGVGAAVIEGRQGPALAASARKRRRFDLDGHDHLLWWVGRKVPHGAC